MGAWPGVTRASADNCPQSDNEAKDFRVQEHDRVPHCPRLAGGFGAGGRSPGQGPFHGVRGHPGKIAGLGATARRAAWRAGRIGGRAVDFAFHGRVQGAARLGAQPPREGKGRPHRAGNRPQARQEGKQGTQGRSQAGLVAHGFHQAGQHVGVD